MRFLLIGLALLAGFATPVATAAETTKNPDQITVYFPAFQGDGMLGQNVATVMSLQLAQTTRRRPWPRNPKGHDFGSGAIVWSKSALAERTHEAAAKAASAIDLLAQIVIWGRARQYAGDIIADIVITLPEFADPKIGCAADGPPCDYRERHFELWRVETPAGTLTVGPPSRRFTLSSAQFKPEIVSKFRTAKGLPITADRSGGRVKGFTDLEMLFIEFNPKLPGAPTKLKSNGVVGYVMLPSIWEDGSEFAEMAGGVLQVFRGDWERAAASFLKVIENPAARAPIKLDALLYRGMALIRDGKDGVPALELAMERAPFDARAVRYLAQGLLRRGRAEDRRRVRDLLKRKRLLFHEDDVWRRIALAAAEAR